MRTTPSPPPLWSMTPTKPYSQCCPQLRLDYTQPLNKDKEIPNPFTSNQIHNISPANPPLSKLTLESHLHPSFWDLYTNTIQSLKVQTSLSPPISPISPSLTPPGTAILFITTSALRVTYQFKNKVLATTRMLFCHKVCPPGSPTSAGTGCYPGTPSSLNQYNGLQVSEQNGARRTNNNDDKGFYETAHKKDK